MVEQAAMKCFKILSTTTLYIRQVTLNTKDSI